IKEFVITREFVEEKLEDNGRVSKLRAA
ncbi:MAG: hypothetical protein RLZZ367_1136, partial [Bacteroidota bacterium]